VVGFGHIVHILPESEEPVPQEEGNQIGQFVLDQSQRTTFVLFSCVYIEPAIFGEIDLSAYLSLLNDGGRH
jgi:hypothetical protein